MSLLTSVLTGGSNSHTTTSEEINAVFTDFTSQGVIGTISNTSGVAPATGSFAVNAQGTPDTTVAITAGRAYITATPTSQNSQTFRVKNTATASLTISANASGSTKYDWIYVKLDPTNLNTPNTAGDNAATIVASRSSSATADDGTPPSFGYCIAVVTVANGFATITNANIADPRIAAGMTPIPVAASAVSDGWTSLGSTPSSVVYNGNRSYTCTFSSVNLTTTISPGYRFRTTRTVTAPTQSTSLNGTTQYYSKTSPAGMTFTDDFVVSAWVKMTSYGTVSAIISRYNGTSGWTLQINASGQVQLAGFNAGAGNNSFVLSSQSIPLNKWTHITAQLDMSTFTATSTTSYIMLDGVDVPCTVTRAGTNPTALVQAGDINVGAASATTPFPGKIAQVAVFNAKVTQATMRGYMSQGLLGTETSLISAYSFNGVITDLNTSNANNLTANGSAVATNADSPFGGLSSGLISPTSDYGIVMSASFSTSTTVVVQVPEGCAIPTTGGVASVAYSSNKVPFNFPDDMGKWRIAIPWKSQTATASNATFAQMAGMQLIVPIGAWALGFNLCLYSTVVIDMYFNFSSTSQTGLASTTSDTSTQARISNPAAGGLTGQFLIRNSYNLSVATTFLMYSLGATTGCGLAGSTGLCEFFAENAYL